MAEYKLHHCVTELIEALGLKNVVAPEDFMGNLTSTSLDAATLTTSAREAVRNLAASTSNPLAVQSKYDELRAQNYEELDKFVVFLLKAKEKNAVARVVRAGLPKDQTSKIEQPKPSVDSIKESSVIATSTPKAFTATSTFVELKNKLQNFQSGDKTASTSKSGASSTNSKVPQNPEWFGSRPHMSCDFAGSGLSAGNVGWLVNLPLSDQERTLVAELLNVLLGFEGLFIKSLPIQGEATDRQLEVNSGVPDSFREMIGRFAPLVAAFSTVQRFIETRTGYSHGPVNDALAAAFQELVHDYRIFICQLENLSIRNELTLHKAWYLIQPNLCTMLQMKNIAAAIMKAHLRGGQVLSLLHQESVESMGDEKKQKLLLFLTQAASQPYWETLHTWIYEGVVQDPYQEFLVEDHEVTPMDRISPTAYSDDYWEKRYTLRRDKIPNFLLPLAEKIIRTGKYLNVIRQCGIGVKPPKVDQLYYTMDGKLYTEAIEEAYRYSSENLLQLLMKDFDLLGRLKSAKHYFFLDSGDFILQFLSLCAGELDKNVDDVMPSRLESLLELALRTSTANADPFKDDLGIDLLPYDLTFQMSRILSIQTNEEHNVSSDFACLTGLEAFSFMYRVRWPVSLVFTTKVMPCYQMIFRHLFYAKHVENLLGQVSVSQKGVFQVSTPSHWYNAAFALRHKMLHFVQNLLYYITVEVLEPSWHKFVQKILQADNVDQVITTHIELLNVCMKESMLTNLDLLCTTTKLMKLCQSFATFIMKMQKHTADAEFGPEEPGWTSSCETSQVSFRDDVFSDNHADTFDQTVAKMELQFSALLSSLLHKISEAGQNSAYSKMINLLRRLNFNEYYNEKLVHLSSYGEISG